MAVCALRSISRTVLNFSRTKNNAIAGRRNLLSASYGNNTDLTKFIENKKQQHTSDNISTVCLFIDRCSEKGQPYSSAVVDRMVNSIEDPEDITTSLYYLYKFRHTDTCYYFRPWTIHNWILKCIAYNEIDLALKALKDSVHYGIFPDEVAFHLLIDHCLVKQAYNKAFLLVSYLFTSEELQSKISQILSLDTLFNFVNKSMEPENMFGLLSEVLDKRNFGGVCLRLGQLMQKPSLELIGLSVLGSVEKKHGIQAVYQDPWAPLLWKEGLLLQALNMLQETDKPLSQEALDVLLHVANGNEQLLSDINLAISSLTAKNLIKEEENISKVIENLLQNLQSLEDEEMATFSATVHGWVSTDAELRAIEKQIFTEWMGERQRLAAETKIKKTARKMAVEKLGYWELMSQEEEESDKLHLREDYVEGSISDVHIERRRETDQSYFFDSV